MTTREYDRPRPCDVCGRRFFVLGEIDEARGAMRQARICFACLKLSTPQVAQIARERCATEIANELDAMLTDCPF